MFNRIIKIRKPRNLLLLFNILAIGLLMIYKDVDHSQTMGGLMAALMILLYLSNIILEKISPGDNYLFMVVSLLVSIGATINYSIDQSLGITHLTWALVGVGGFFVTYLLLKYIDIWDKLMSEYIVLALALFVLTQVLGTNIRGATNWINIGGVISFQPSEFIKIILIFILACFYYKKKHFSKIKYSSAILTAIVYVFIGFLFLQRDLGTAVIFLAIFIGIQFIYEENRKLILLSIAMTLVGVVAGYFLFSHVRTRFQIWQDPWSEGGYQILESLFAIASGGFTGSGIGLGYPGLIPIVSSDFIFSAIVEEMGLLAGIGVIMLYIILAYRGFKVALVQRHPFYRILALGVSISFSIQTFLAIGGVVKFIPMTGITLPFVSYGGSSMFASFVALGILQVGSEELRHKKIEVAPDYE